MLTNAERERVQAKKKASSAISKILKFFFFFWREGRGFFLLFPCALIGVKPAIT